MTITLRNKSSKTLTPLELEIMQVLWKKGLCTVADVQRKLRGDLAYTTVQTMLNVLLRKKQVKRLENLWAFRYRAVVSRERAAGSALSDLMKRMFGGSGEAMVRAMVETRQIRAEDLLRIAKKLAAMEDATLKEKQ